MRARFTATASVVLDAFGNSPVTNGVQSGCLFSPSGVSWIVDRVTVSCSSRVKEARCVMYQRMISAGTEVGRTYAGSSGDTNTDQVMLADGDSLHVVWTGGDAGATATAVISGYTDVPDRGFRAVQ